MSQARDMACCDLLHEISEPMRMIESRHHVLCVEISTKALTSTLLGTPIFGKLGTKKKALNLSIPENDRNPTGVFQVGASIQRNLHCSLLVLSVTTTKLLLSFLMGVVWGSKQLRQLYRITHYPGNVFFVTFLGWLRNPFKG